MLLLFNLGSRRVCYALALLVIATTGCARMPWSDVEPLKYETVPTSNRHDTQTAKKKHAEALVLLEEGKGGKHLAKAEVLLNESLVADVTYGPAHNSLGLAYYLQNKLYLAAWEFEYAAKLMPEFAQPYNNLGLVYECAGKYEEAIGHYSTALSKNAKDWQVIGNLVRARLITGDKGADLKVMISDLALNHPDPTWRKWAREQVEFGKFADSAGKPGLTWEQATGPPETLPRPIPEPAFIEPGLTFPESLAPAND